jgi:hypothetical protein
MAMALTVAENCTGTLRLDGLSLEFVLDMDSSVQRARARVERGVLSEQYLEGYINVISGGPDLATYLLIPGQDVGAFGILFSRFLDLIDTAAEEDFKEILDGNSFSGVVREKSSLSYSTDGRDFSFEDLSRLTGRVVTESYLGRLSIYKSGGKFFLEAELFKNGEIFCAGVETEELKMALEALRREFSDRLTVRMGL